MTGEKVSSIPIEVRLDIWEEIVGIYRGISIEPDQSAAIFVITHGVMRYLWCVIADPLYNAVIMSIRDYQLKGINPIGFRIQILRTPLLDRPWCVAVRPVGKLRRKKRRTAVRKNPDATEIAEPFTPQTEERKPDTSA